MGCLKWIVNILFSIFVALFFFGNVIGVYALKDVPSWVGGEYVENVESVVGEPVSAVYPYRQTQLKVVVATHDSPVIISTQDVAAPSSAVKLSLMFTSFVQQGMTMMGGLWLVMTVIQIVFAIFRMVM